MSASHAVRGAVALAAVTAFLLVLRAPAGAADYAGAKGKFTTSKTTDGFTGAQEIKITYYPDPKKVGACSSIYLVQTVRRTDQNGNVIQPKDLDAGKFKHAQDDMTAGGTCVDHLSTETDPYYNGEDATKDDQSRGSTDGTSDATATEMTDGPHYDDDTFPAGVTEATLTFETCAVCKDNGNVLDCVTWTYHRTKGEAGMGTITEPTAAAPPTQEFKDAKKKFEKNHLNGLICPEGIAEIFEGLLNSVSGFFAYMPSFPHPMQPTQLIVDVVNSSGRPMNSVQWTAFDQHGTRFLGAGTIPQIGPFNYLPVVFTVPPVPDPGTVDSVIFTVDPTNAIPEYDETDNQEIIPVGYYGPVGVEEGPRVSVAGQIRVSPSPFRLSTTVAFMLPRAAAVRVEVFDLSGARVRLLYAGRLEAGARTLEWDGRTDSGRRAAAGIYVVRVGYEGRSLEGKVTLIR